MGEKRRMLNARRITELFLTPRYAYLQEQTPAASLWWVAESAICVFFEMKEIKEDVNTDRDI